jgi:hypothetical protein
MSEKMITVLKPELKPAPTLDMLYDYADHEKIGIQRFKFVSRQMVFNWIATRSGLTQPELYDVIMAYGKRQ